MKWTAKQKKAHSAKMKAAWAKKKSMEYSDPTEGWTSLKDLIGENLSDKDVRNDPVNHPKHYTNHPSGVEAIQVTEHFNFCVGNAIKYLWRAGLKGNYIEDLKKAKFYVEREIERMENAQV